ncbi:MAG: AcrB/AcrD/AcrF family protein [Sphingomicrobium sp.]
MSGRKKANAAAILLDHYDRHWKWLVVAVWLGFAAYFIAQRYSDIQFFNLTDTDDNMRFMQVRALLDGQGWYDLRQYRLNPPYGADIHWSRLVDLPLAGLILLLRPFLGGAEAARWAVAIGPLLPYLVMLFALASTVRRLVDRRAWPLAFIALFFCGSANGMFMPERIDHHGWQLAMLAVAVSAIADPKRLRGGLVLGAATAGSLAIGLELLIYLALAGSLTVLAWIIDRDQAPRLRGYALAMSGGTSLAFLLFASNANWFAVCDALSPVWLSDAVLGGALLFALTWRSPADWRVRLALAAAAGAAIAAFHGLAWPHCLTRLEGVSPEVERLWLSHVREARPIWKHGLRTASTIVAVPITGLVGWALLAWWKRKDRDLLRRILSAAAPGTVAVLLLMWQTRTGPAAQMLGTIGAAALPWLLVPVLWRLKNPYVAAAASAAVGVVGLGGALPLVMNYVPNEPANATGLAIRRANAGCNSLWGWRTVAAQPKGIVFSFVDTGPRLIAVTHHDGIIGPYHRNGQQIADVMNAFRGSADQARAIIGKYRADYLLVCPNSSTTTIFRSEAPGGFYDQLAKDKVPAWLTPIDLGADAPFRMWKVAR